MTSIQAVKALKGAFHEHHVRGRGHPRPQLPLVAEVGKGKTLRPKHSCHGGISISKYDSCT
jgi:hypothetical protein